MTPANKHTTDNSYTYEKSDTVPVWVSKLDGLKSKIKAHLHSPDSDKTIDVKFCHPVNVPSQEK